MVEVRGRKVALIESGRGEPLVYLHGFADVHGVAGDFQPFHLRLGTAARVIAPAHPGCAQSDELAEGYGIEDVIFHYLEVFDALGLTSFDLVGHCVGGWIAAELAVRYPERVRRLGLIGACGLFVPGAPIGDVFMHSQPERGVQLTSLAASCCSPTKARRPDCGSLPAPAATSRRRCGATRCCASAPSSGSSRRISTIASCAGVSTAPPCRPR